MFTSTTCWNPVDHWRLLVLLQKIDCFRSMWSCFSWLRRFIGIVASRAWFAFWRISGWLWRLRWHHWERWYGLNCLPGQCSKGEVGWCDSRGLHHILWLQWLWIKFSQTWLLWASVVQVCEKLLLWCGVWGYWLALSRQRSQYVYVWFRIRLDGEANRYRCIIFKENYERHLHCHQTLFQLQKKPDVKTRETNGGWTKKTHG